MSVVVVNSSFEAHHTFFATEFFATASFVTASPYLLCVVLMEAYGHGAEGFRMDDVVCS